MLPNVKTLIVCILAAAISAILSMALWVSLINTSFCVFFLGFLVAFPILIVAFRHGIYASILSAVVAVFFLIPNLSFVTALLFALFFFTPSVFVVWLIVLKQTDRQEGVVIWYPLPPALFQLALAIAITTIAVMQYILSSTEVTQYIDRIIAQFMLAISESHFYSADDQAVIEKAIRIRFTSVIASTFPFYGFLCHIGNLYFSTRLAKKIGCLQRPLDDWPTTLRMPSTAFFLFVADWIISPFVYNDTLAICMTVITSALSTGFMISGLAVIHNITRGYAWRTIPLCAIYIGFCTLILTPLITVGLVVVGLLSTSFLSYSNHKIKPPRKDHST